MKLVRLPAFYESPEAYTLQEMGIETEDKYDLIDTWINLDLVAAFCSYEDDNTSLMINGETMVIRMGVEEFRKLFDPV